MSIIELNSENQSISNPQFTSENEKSVDGAQLESSAEDEDESPVIVDAEPSQLNVSLNRFLAPPNISAKTRVSFADLQVRSIDKNETKMLKF